MHRTCLQMTSVGGPVFSIAWDDRRRFLIVGGHSVIHIYKVSKGRGCWQGELSAMQDAELGAAFMP